MLILHYFNLFHLVTPKYIKTIATGQPVRLGAHLNVTLRSSDVQGGSGVEPPRKYSCLVKLVGSRGATHLQSCTAARRWLAAA